LAVAMEVRRGPLQGRKSVGSCDAGWVAETGQVQEKMQREKTSLTTVNLERKLTTDRKTAR
jgi:hypothetical protein